MGIILKTHFTVCFNIIFLLSHVHLEVLAQQDLEIILQKSLFLPVSSTEDMFMGSTVSC